MKYPSTKDEKRLELGKKYARYLGFLGVESSISSLNLYARCHQMKVLDLEYNLIVSIKNIQPTKEIDQNYAKHLGF